MSHFYLYFNVNIWSSSGHIMFQYSVVNQTKTMLKGLSICTGQVGHVATSVNAVSDVLSI